MSDVNANIGVNIDTSDALSQLKALQRQISQFHASVAKSSEAAALAQRDLQRNLVNSINSIQGFSAEMRIVKTSAESFTDALEKNKFSMREYFRYAGAATKTFGKVFKSEYDTIGKVAEERVKKLQTQYIKMGRDASGAMRAIAVIPNELNMKDFSTQTQLAAQKQAIFNQLVKQGSTQLLNFGKNTQWAGRQLMVGFTLPLMALGSTASKAFMDMETAALKFKKVYGDLGTTKEESATQLAAIQDLAKGYTKYGVAAASTVALASDAAAAGFKGLDLQRQTAAASKLAVLGQIDQQQALETTIALQNAFRMSSEDLASSIDFLNAVENQTVTSLDDITTAIPKVAPVIQQLGGNVKDLAFFLTAMKEGGVNASEGANALKSGLASLINPTAKASAMLMDMGINIKNIVEKNKGDLKATVIDFAKALDTLDPLTRARAIEQLFGKFQFARLSTLFQNVTRDGTQASRVLALAGTSIEDLASLSEQELGVTADSAMNKFRKAVEDLKISLVPVGKAFLEAATPILEFVGKILDKFSSLSDGTKKAITIATIAIGAIGPVALMAFGLLANGIANIIKLFGTLRAGYLKLTGQSQVLGEQTQYLTSEQLDAAAAAHSLDQSHAKLIQTFTAEAGAVNQLKIAYEQAVAAGARFAMSNPGMMRTPKKFAKGAQIVPGSGSGDTVPAMLTPGEAVLPTDMVKKYGPIINAMFNDNIPGYEDGLFSVAAAKKKSKLFSAPNAIQTQTEVKSWQTLEAELEAIDEAVKEFNLTLEESAHLTEEQVKNMKRVTAAHKEADTFTADIGDQSMTVKNWKASNLMADTGANTFLNTVNQAKGMMDKFEKEGLDLAAKKLGMSMEEAAVELNKLKQGIHPQTAKAGALLGEVGGFVANQPATKENKGMRWQGAATAAIMQERAKGDFYDTMQQRAYDPSKDEKAMQQVLARVKKVRVLVLKEAEETATEAIIALKRKLGISSPSKETIKVGEQMAEGLQVGLNNGTPEVVAAAENMSTQAMGGVRRGYRKAQRPQGPPSSGNGGGSGGFGGGTGQGGESPEQKQSRISLAKLNSAVMGTTFALTSLAGVGSMAGGFIGDMSQAIFKYTGLLFALMNITQLLTQEQFVALAAARASKVANAMGAANMASLFSKGGGIAGFGKNLLTAGKFAIRFAGGIGLAITAITAAIAVFNFFKRKNEEARNKIEGLGNAAELTDKKLKALGDFFGVTARKSAFERGTTAKTGEVQVGAQTRSQLEGLKADKGFQEAFANDIKSLRGASDTQAKLIFDALAIDLQGKGYAKEQVQTIITAIQEEAGKTKVKFDVKAIDISTKEGQARMAQNAAVLTKSLGASLSKGMETVYRTIYDPKQGKWLTQPFVELSDGAKKNLNLVSKSFTTMMSGLSGQLEAGTISAEQFNIGFQAIGDSIRNMPQAQSLILMKNLLNSLPEKLRTSAASIGDVSSQLMLLKAQAAGVAVTASIIDAMLTVQNTKVTGPDQAKKVAEAKQKIADFEKQINVAAAAWKKLNAAFNQGTGTGTGGNGKESPIVTATKNLKAEKVAIENQIGAYKKLRAQGYSVKDAMDLAGDSMIAAALAAMKIKKGSTEWKEFKKLLDEVLRLRKTAATTNAATQAGINVTDQQTKLNNQIFAMQTLIKYGMDASKALDAVGNEDFVTLILGAKNSSTAMKGVVDQIIAIQNATDQLNQMGDPLYAINKAVEDFTKGYDVAMEDFRIQEQKLRNFYEAPIAAAQSKVDAIKTTIDQINKDIEEMQTQIADKQRDIEMTIDRPIAGIQDQIAKLQKQMEDGIDKPVKALQDSISSMQREMEMQFDRPLKALSDESGILSHDLSIIEREEKKVNDQFDAQQKAMEEINKLNQENIQQNKTKLSIADALSQGDISAAAAAIQDLKAQQAAARAQEQQSALDKARKESLDRITYNGKTRAQIEERQWQISQLSYALEQKKAKVEADILLKQDEIYRIEQGRSLIQDKIAIEEQKIADLEEKRKIILTAIQVLEDNIYDKQNKGTTSLRAKNVELAAAQFLLDEENKKLQTALDAVEGQRKKWEEAKLKIDEAKNYIDKQYVPTLASAEAAAKAIYDQVMKLNTTVTTKHVIETICGSIPVACGGTGNGGNQGGYTPPCPSGEVRDANGNCVSISKDPDPEPEPKPKPGYTAPSPTPEPETKPKSGYSAPATPTPTPTPTTPKSGYSAPSSNSGFQYFGSTGATPTTSINSVGMNIGVNKPITDIITAVTKPATKVVEAVVSGVKTAATAVKTVVEKTVDVAKKVVSSVASGVSNVASKVGGFLGGLFGGKDEPKVSGGGGGGSIGGGKALAASMLLLSSGGLVKPKYFSVGGMARGTDRIPAMLSPGEYIVSKPAVDSIGKGTLDKINNGEGTGQTLYNYNLSVTLNGGDMDAQEVANVVMNKLKQVENQKIKRQKLQS